MADRTLRGSRLGAISYETEYGAEPAPRNVAAYRCQRGHEFRVPFSEEADVPSTWECRLDGTSGVHHVRIEVTRGTCHDGMSGTAFDTAVTVIRDDATLHGLFEHDAFRTQFLIDLAHRRAKRFVPAGIALDAAGATLYVADYTNNAVEKLNLGNNLTTTFLTSGNGISGSLQLAVSGAVHGTGP